ncbi:hypothetical protein [Marinobacter zhanjiangensis]|uniref:YheU family protein n=1 Tax=Marinobacter zhanjiangensis TaxID=578215 RepID=A0ABQ3AUX5_9GAMM|nr:hypothetical protein [Marinobacter zhanjiangensis]GGY66888.1 hypothetical protein GCM10007071_12270 [Marinobacter zhanjiangensis]
MDQNGKVPDSDPREAPFMVDADLLSEDQLEGLVQEYCTRYHGLNDQESPLGERDRVMNAVRRGDLVVWFDPVENTAGLGRPSGP